jgi:hypothetical protein
MKWQFGIFLPVLLLCQEKSGKPWAHHTILLSEHFFSTLSWNIGRLFGCSDSYQETLVLMVPAYLYGCLAGNQSLYFEIESFSAITYLDGRLTFSISRPGWLCLHSAWEHREKILNRHFNCSMSIIMQQRWWYIYYIHPILPQNQRISVQSTSQV